jgi:hypothetical protein
LVWTRDPPSSLKLLPRAILPGHSEQGQHLVQEIIDRSWQGTAGPTLNLDLIPSEKKPVCCIIHVQGSAGRGQYHDA